jgi:hypothetical protein
MVAILARREGSGAHTVAGHLVGKKNLCGVHEVDGKREWGAATRRSEPVFVTPDGRTPVDVSPGDPATGQVGGRFATRS